MAKGLVISGGGPNIIYMTGALHELNKKGYQFDVVGGNSSGALITAAYCTGQLDTLVDLVLSISNEDVYKRRDTVQNAVWSTLIGRLSLLSNEPVKELIRDTMLGKEIEKYGIYGAVDLLTGKYHTYELQPGEKFNEDAFNYLIGSSTFPPYFPPQHHYDKSTNRDLYLVDGGIYHHKPIGMVLDFAKNLDKRLDQVVIISSTSLKPSKIDKVPKNWIGYSMRGFELVFDSNMLRDYDKFIERNEDDDYIHYNYKVISPTFKLNKFTDFNDKSGFEIGRAHARAQFS